MTRYVVVVFLVCSTPTYAAVRLPKVLGPHMVLQQNSQVKIWGWAESGEAIKVHGDWSDESQKTTAGTDGRWHVEITSGTAGGPHAITIEGANKIILDDVLFGEVWIASGQSNMEMPLIKVSEAYTGIKDADTEVANAKYPTIRLFQVGNFSSKEPLEDVESGIEMYGVPPAKCQWQSCQPDTIPTFSSTAYFFARELYRQLDVPIGIIDSSWGGTSAETWTPSMGLNELKYEAELDQALQLPQNPDQKIPTRLYNGMIHPLRHLKIKGVIWYQGEGNSTRADKYRTLFSTMIRQWRLAFGEEFPFYYVQIAPFNYPHNAALLREAQVEALSLPKTGMVVTMDIGNLTDIHPKDKQEVGRRLALLAMAKEYEKQLVSSGPLYKEAKFHEGKAEIQFDHVGGGLATRDGQPPSHLEIAGSDKVFYQGTAEIVGNSLIVSSDKVNEPQAVRYGFTSDAMPNLMNKEGLPASPFRTDRW